MITQSYEQQPSRIQALLRAYRKHTMDIDKLFISIQDWATHPSICRPTPAQLAAIVAARDQFLVRFPMSFRNIIGESLKYGLNEMTRFYLENNFDEDPELIGVCSENPVLAITYTSEYARTLTAAQFAERIRTLLTEPLLRSRLLRAGKLVQSALIQRCLHYLPETAEGAAILNDLLTAAPSGFEPHHFTVSFRGVHFAPFLADALFRHPAARPHLYVQYAAKYENKAASFLSWHDLSQRSLRAWKAVDQRILEERARLRHAAWRSIFWGAIVLQWRKKEFIQRYYAPGGKGAAAAATHFYESITTAQPATDEHTNQEIQDHLPSTHEQGSGGYVATEYYTQDSRVTICAAVTLP